MEMSITNYVTGTADELAVFTSHAIRTKEQVLACIEQAKRAALREQQTSTLPGRYFANYHMMLKNFEEKVRFMKFFDNLEPWWCYQVVIDEQACLVKLCYGRANLDELDCIYAQQIPMLKVENPLLSVEEFAELYLVETVTVRQWLRRGKILSAIKLGTVWQIPNLAVVEGRKPRKHIYYWGNYVTFTGNLESLNPYQAVVISKLKDSKNYKVFGIPKFDKDKDWTKGGTAIVTNKEKEILELELLEHPKVHSISLKSRSYQYVEEAQDATWVMGDNGYEISNWKKLYR